MATITKPYSESLTSSKTQNGYEAFLKKLNFNYFGLISMTITIGSIIGGIAAMSVLENDGPIWELAICMAMAMSNNVAAIGQAPIKWLFNTFAITTVINILLILVNL